MEAEAAKLKQMQEAVEQQLSTGISSFPNIFISYRLSCRCHGGE